MDHLMEVTISPQITNLKRLKIEIIDQHGLSILPENIKIYNYKGIELDSTDVPYLLNNQVIYICPEGDKFSNGNYLNHLEFIKEVKPTRSGVVLLAKNLLEHNQILIIKKIKLRLLSNDDIFDILKETRVIEGIKHRHIVNLLNSWIFEDRMYIEMYYYNGGDLKSYLDKTGPLSEKEAKVYMKHLVEAVRFYHRKNVVHRNLSPFNILFKTESKEDLVVSSCVNNYFRL